MRQPLLTLLLLALASCSPRAADEKSTPVLNLTGHLSEVYTVAFSPDGKRLASASNREVIVWDLSAGKALFTYHITGTNVFGLALTPDGTPTGRELQFLHHPVMRGDAGETGHERLDEGVHPQVLVERDR
jgi:WD40 repeat protein